MYNDITVPNVANVNYKERMKIKTNWTDFDGDGECVSNENNQK